MADSTSNEANEKDLSKKIVKKKSSSIPKNKDFEEIFEKVNIDDVDLELDKKKSTKKVKVSKKKKPTTPTKVSSSTQGVGDSKKPNINIKDKDHMIDGIGDLDAYIANSKSKSSPTKISIKNGASYNFLSQEGIDVRKLDNLYAIVPHGKGEHKLVWQRDTMPENLWNDDKGRTKGTEYIKNGNKIYDVHVDFKRHKDLRTSDGERYDVWIIDTPEDLENQLKAIKNGLGGGKNFGAAELVKVKGTKTKIEEKTKETKTKTSTKTEEEIEEKKATKDKAVAEEKIIAEEKAAKNKAAKAKAEEKIIAEEKAEKEAIAEKKAAEEKIIAKKKAAEEKIIAEKKAAEEKIIAEKKAAEEKIIAEKKAAKEKIIAEKKAAKDKAAAEEKIIAAEKDNSNKKTEIQIDDIVENDIPITPPMITPTKTITESNNISDIDISSLTDIDDEIPEEKVKVKSEKIMPEKIIPEAIIEKTEVKEIKKVETEAKVKEAKEIITEDIVQDASPEDIKEKDADSKVMSSNFFDEIEESPVESSKASGGFDRKKLLIRFIGLCMILTVLALGWLIRKVMFSNTTSDTPTGNNNADTIVIPGEDADDNQGPENYDNEIIIPEKQGDSDTGSTLSGEVVKQEPIPEPDNQPSEAYILEQITTLRVLKKDTRTLLNKARLINNPDAYNYSLAAYSRANEIVENYDKNPSDVSVEDMEKTIDRVRLYIKSVRDLID